MVSGTSYRRVRIGPSGVSSTAQPSSPSSSRNRSASGQSLPRRASSLSATWRRTLFAGSSKYRTRTPSTSVTSSCARSNPRFVRTSRRTSASEENSPAASGRVEIVAHRRVEPPCKFGGEVGGERGGDARAGDLAIETHQALVGATLLLQD